MGTFDWAAPECLTGDYKLTEKADIYSLGVVLWEIVTHEVPRRRYMRDIRCGQNPGRTLENPSSTQANTQATAPATSVDNPGGVSHATLLGTVHLSVCVSFIL